MLIPFTFSVSPREFFPAEPPLAYNVGVVVYILQGKELNGDLIYRLKKIPNKKVNAIFFNLS